MHCRPGWGEVLPSHVTDMCRLLHLACTPGTHTLNLLHLLAIRGLVPRKPQESTGVTNSDRA